MFTNTTIITYGNLGHECTDAVESLLNANKWIGVRHRLRPAILWLKNTTDSRVVGAATAQASEEHQQRRKVG